LTGCGSLKTPTILTAEVMSSNKINPDNSGRPSPMMIRIYELKTSGSFDVADYFSIFKDDSSMLGVDLINMEELYLQPGDRKSYTHSISENTRYLGVLAGYRNLNKAVWKASVKLPEDETKEVWIFLDELAVYVHTK
jgi:type VI secretion system protein VasD